jgi:hypothetical protein
MAPMSDTYMPPHVAIPDDCRGAEAPAIYLIRCRFMKPESAIVPWGCTAAVLQKLIGVRGGAGRALVRRLPRTSG